MFSIQPLHQLSLSSVLFAIQPLHQLSLRLRRSPFNHHLYPNFPSFYTISYLPLPFSQHFFRLHPFHSKSTSPSTLLKPIPPSFTFPQLLPLPFNLSKAIPLYHYPFSITPSVYTPIYPISTPPSPPPLSLNPSLPFSPFPTFCLPSASTLSITVELSRAKNKGEKE